MNEILEAEYGLCRWCHGETPQAELEDGLCRWCALLQDNGGEG